MLRVLGQANSVIRPRQGQSSGASCWQCCVGYERSPEEQTPSATALFFQPKQLLLFFQGWLIAFLWLFPSAKCWWALKCHATTVLSRASFCVFRKPGLDVLRGAKKYASDLLGQYSLCTQLWVPTGTLWGMIGMIWEGEGKVGHFACGRADWCRCSRSAPLTFLRSELLSVTRTA